MMIADYKLGYNESMEPYEIKKLSELENKLDEIYMSVEKTRRYFLWTLVITVFAVVLPLIGISFVAPTFISNYTTNLENVSGY